MCENSWHATDQSREWIYNIFGIRITMMLVSLEESYTALRYHRSHLNQWIDMRFNPPLDGFPAPADALVSDPFEFDSV
jgi:hypothetical protein